MADVQIKEVENSLASQSEEKSYKTESVVNSETKMEVESTKKHWWQRRAKKVTEKTEKPEAKVIPEKPTDSLEANLKALALHMEVKERNDYWHLRIRKKTGLIVGGLIILVLWVGWFFGRVNQDREWSIKGMFLVSQKETPAPTPMPLPAEVIRIRYKNVTQATAAADLASKLAGQGLPVVDTILDDQSDYDGVMVIGKTDKLQLVTRLEGILAQDYQLASPGAELTVDSDFDAVILFAPQATRSAGVQ